eukprot:5244075-Amphidinium_carterae.1
MACFSTPQHITAQGFAVNNTSKSPGHAQHMSFPIPGTTICPYTSAITLTQNLRKLMGLFRALWDAPLHGTATRPLSSQRS